VARDLKKPKRQRPAAARRPPKRQSPKRRAAPAQKVAGSGARTVDVEPGRIEEMLQKLRTEVGALANKGRYTRVRFKFRGKQLLPDLPLAAVIAAEGLTFYWTGILRTLLVNVAGKSVLSVELVNDSGRFVQAGKDELIAGEVDRAIEAFRKALRMERDNPRAHLHLGAALRLKGNKAEAREALERALALDPHGEVGREATELLRRMKGAVPEPAEPKDRSTPASE
jgi:tetratricopeptide (TPR) repeat protein